MPQWIDGNVTTNGIRLHYYRTGGDKPPIVLLHGFTDDGLCWSPVAKALESDYDVIMVDARGHGLSEAPAEGYSSSNHAADVAGLIQALGLQQPVVIGHSMGAATAYHLAASYPDRLRCAILEDPPLQAPAETAEAAADMARMRERIVQDAREAKTLPREEAIARQRQQRPTWSEEELGPWADAKKRVSPHAFNVLHTPRPDWRAILPQISCPVLLITADPDLGAIVTPEVAEQASSILPSLKVVRLRGAGHNIRREQFEGYLQVVREFLASSRG